MNHPEALPDRYSSAGEDLVEFLLNHRGILEYSVHDVLLRRMLDSMMRDPGSVFYYVSYALLEWSDMRKREAERVLRLLQYSQESFTTLDGVIQCQAQHPMGKATAIGLIPGHSGGATMESSD